MSDIYRDMLAAVGAAWPVKIGDDGRTYVCAYCVADERGDRTRHSASCPVSQARRALGDMRDHADGAQEAAMAIVTDGLDATTLARWRARLVALRGEMEAVWDQGQPGGRAAYLAWSGVGNATVVLGDALAQLDRAAIELADDAEEGDGDVWQYPDPASAAWRAEYDAAMARRDWQTAAQMLDERAARECPAEATTATQGDGRAVEDVG